MDTILNAEGKPVVLNAAEQYHAEYVQQQVNARFKNVLGYEIPITTLTTIMKKISEQKFFKVAPSEYLPVLAGGEGAWSSQLTTYRSYSMSDDFATGVLNMGSHNSRLAMADSGVDAINIAVHNWAKAIGWNIIDLEQAAKSGNWDIVSSKEKSRKMNFDLGVQEVAFLGLKGNTDCLGLLNQAGITTNTSFLTNSITSLAQTPNNLSTFIGGLLNLYRSNNNRTAWPTHFIIPESDYLGLATPSSPSYPIKSILQLMQETFQTMTGNANFKILPLAYADSAYNSAAGINKQCYVLLNYDEESLRMNVPVPYTSTLANSIDNFSFQNVAYSQFTGVLAIRPLELFYLQY